MTESSRQIFCNSVGDTCVKCIVGVENGHLYPLSNGVYFLNKPYIFLSFDDMVGLEQGRAGSGLPHRDRRDTSARLHGRHAFHVRPPARTLRDLRRS